MINNNKINYLKYKIKYINLKNNINDNTYVKNKLILHQPEFKMKQQ